MELAWGPHSCPCQRGPGAPPTLPPREWEPREAEASLCSAGAYNVSFHCSLSAQPPRGRKQRKTAREETLMQAGLPWPGWHGEGERLQG